MFSNQGKNLRKRQQNRFRLRKMKKFASEKIWMISKEVSQCRLDAGYAIYFSLEIMRELFTKVTLICEPWRSRPESCKLTTPFLIYTAINCLRKLSFQFEQVDNGIVNCSATYRNFPKPTYFVTAEHCLPALYRIVMFLFIITIITIITTTPNDNPLFSSLCDNIVSVHSS